MTEFYPTDFKSIGELSPCGISSAVVAIGVFDGVHRGHQRLLTELLSMAKALSADPVVMTFFPHPRQLLTANPPPLLLPPEEKIRLLYRFGAKAVVTVDFTREFASLSPTEFLNRCLFSGPVAIRGICVGRKWRFGAHAGGDSRFLEHKAETRGFRFAAVDELCTEQGTVISSTAIRAAVSKGNLREAEEMLGRRYSLFGTVEKGYKVASGKLGSPTANLKIRDGVLPLLGVYAAFVHLNGRRFPAAVNIGTSPTFRNQYGDIAPRIEIHILEGFKADLYGLSLELELVEFIRPEQEFANPEELKQQIARDVGQIAGVLREGN